MMTRHLHLFVRTLDFQSMITFVILVSHMTTFTVLGFPKIPRDIEDKGRAAMLVSQTKEIIIRWKFSFSLAQGPPRDLQIIAYKYDFVHAHNYFAEFSCKYDTTHA